MLRFDQGNLRFNYRSVAVLLNGTKVLIHKSPKDNFWALSGGRVEFNEPANQTVKREMQEELGIDVCVERLLWIVESFFDYNDKSYHELGCYFLVSAPIPANFYTEIKTFAGIEPDKDLIFKWHEIAALTDIELHPKFLQNSLPDLTQVPEYIVHYG
jgi:8-oxo-dGTP pyrophosphatase MutT (NUDIX family)